MPIPGSPHTYGPWNFGVNYSVPPDELNQQEMSGGQDVRIGKGGEGMSRKGTTPYNGTAISGGAAYTACGQHDFNASTSREFAVNGDKFYEGASGTWTDRSSTMTITAGDDNTFSHVDANGTRVLTNGVSGDNIMKWTAAGGNAAALEVDSRFTWAKWTEFFDNRLWMANTSTGTDEIWHSDIADIETWGATSFFQIGEIITGVKAIGDILAVHSERAITGLMPTGNAVTPYRKKKRGNAGTISGRSVVTVQVPAKGELQVYVRKDGIYAFNGVDSLKISGRLDGDGFWGLVDKTRLKQSFAEHYEAENEVWFYLPVAASVGASQTTMNRILVYDYLRNIFYPPWTAGLNEEYTCSGIVDRVIYSGDANDGFLYKHEEGLNDTNGTSTTAIDSSFLTASSPPQGPEVTLRWLYARHSFDIEGDYTVTASFLSPNIPGDSSTFNQGGGFASIGAFEIGEDKIAPDTMVANQDTHLNGYDPTLQFQFRNRTESESMRIRSTTAIYKPIGRVRKH